MTLFHIHQSYSSHTTPSPLYREHKRGKRKEQALMKIDLRTNRYIYRDFSNSYRSTPFGKYTVSDEYTTQKDIPHIINHLNIVLIGTLRFWNNLPHYNQRLDQQVSSEKDRKFYRSWWQLLLQIVSYTYITLNNHTRNEYSDMVQWFLFFPSFRQAESKKMHTFTRGSGSRK